MLDKTSSIICAFGLAAAAPRSPYRHLEFVRYYPIFFSAWKFLFARCLVLCFFLFYFRCIVIYCFYPCCFAFYFTVKTALFSTLTSQTFFFLRENFSLFFIKFLNKTHFSNVAALLFLCPVFFFFLWKPLSVPLLILPYIRASAFHPALFSFCVNFSLNKQRKNALFLIFLRCIVFFCVLQFSFFPVKITLFSA